MEKKDELLKNVVKNDVLEETVELATKSNNGKAKKVAIVTLGAAIGAVTIGLLIKGFKKLRAKSKAAKSEETAEVTEE